MSFALIVLSFFGCGLLPKVPGTWGTAGAAIAAYGMMRVFPAVLGDWLVVCAAWVVAASAVTVLLTPIVVSETGMKDPQVIVTDEVAGYFTTIAFVGRPDLAT